MVALRTRMPVVFGSVFILALSSTAGFAADGWHIVDTAGEVTSGGAGYMPASLNKQDVLPADAWVETKANGRAVLARGLESIVVGPNSRVQLPNEEVNGNTQVLQSMGSALYRIGKQSRPHFQVDTPYLAAVVKGTQFTVTVTEDNASVTVTEGRVEVATPDQSDVEFVTPGFTATVSHGHGGDVVVEKTSGAPSSAASPEPTGKSASNAHVGGALAPGSIEIATTVGEVELNVKEVSGGLAYGELKSAMEESGAGGGASKVKDGKDDSVSGSIVASIDEGSSGKGNSGQGGSGSDAAGSSPDLSGGSVVAVGGATPPGLGGATPPGLGGATPPGLGGATPPGLGGATPPGLSADHRHGH